MKKFLILSILSIVFLSYTTVLAGDVDPTTGKSCIVSVDNCLNDPSGKSYDCIADAPLVKQADGSILGHCKLSPIKNILGKIEPPPPLAGLLQKDSTGAGAISDFLSRAIVLIFSVASIVLIFMLLWGAFEWMISAGDKEKIAGAQRRIINAIIGIILFAVAFAVIQVLGIFTGFTFFKGQHSGSISDGCCRGLYTFDKTKNRCTDPLDPGGIEPSLRCYSGASCRWEGSQPVCK